MNELEKELTLDKIQQFDTSKNPYFSREDVIKGFKSQIPKGYSMNQEYINLMRVLETCSKEELSYLLENYTTICEGIVSCELSWEEIKYFRREKRSGQC